MISEEAGWPALGWAEHPWRSSIPPDLVPRRIREQHQGSYRAAVVPHIGRLTPPLSPGTVTAALEASAEVSRFDAEVGTDIAPFSSVLLRSEAASSSQIENLTAGARAIALAELGATDKRNAAQIVGNVATMQAALELADRLDAPAILTMQAALLADSSPDIAGRWRTEQVWIGGSSYGPHQAAYVAPTHQDIPDLIEDLVGFMRRTDLAALVQAAVAHAQFETIHPFVDGNGRTGRAILHALLRSRGLASRVTVPISAGLLSNLNSYFDALTAYREGDVNPIVLTVAQGALEAVTNGRQLVAELDQVRQEWAERINARQGSAARRLSEHLLKQPVVDAAAVADALGIEVRNTFRAIEPLTAAGIITEFTGWKRNRIWQAPQVLAALDDFAARAGKRQNP